MISTNVAWPVKSCFHYPAPTNNHVWDCRYTFFADLVLVENQSISEPPLMSFFLSLWVSVKLHEFLQVEKSGDPSQTLERLETNFLYN